MGSAVHGGAWLMGSAHGGAWFMGTVVIGNLQIFTTEHSINHKTHSEHEKKKRKLVQPPRQANI